MRITWFDWTALCCYSGITVGTDSIPFFKVGGNGGRGQIKEWSRKVLARMGDCLGTPGAGMGLDFDAPWRRENSVPNLPLHLLVYSAGD